MNGYWTLRFAVLSMLLSGCGQNDDPISVTVVHVPDSGQTQSYTSTFGQDSDYSLHPPSYSDNGNGTITDNVTGLIWQKEYDSSARSFLDADAYCAGLTLANLSGWRMPSDFELMTIVDYGTTVPAINGTYFPNSPSDFPWWTLTDEKSSSFFKGRWAVDLRTGNLDTYSSSGYTRCVLGEQNQLSDFQHSGQNQPRVFEDNKNGTITDRITQLVWQKQDDGTTAAWEEAIIKCEDLSLGGYSDWRVPNVKELRSIVDSRTYAPAIYPGYFPNTRSETYWSSTTYGASPSAAWSVNFWHGEVTDSPKGNALYVRCVRAGE
jgi:hypothetical protein